MKGLLLLVSLAIVRGETCVSIATSAGYRWAMLFNSSEYDGLNYSAPGWFNEFSPQGKRMRLLDVCARQAFFDMQFWPALDALMATAMTAEAREGHVYPRAGMAYSVVETWPALIRSIVSSDATAVGANGHARTLIHFQHDTEALRQGFPWLVARIHMLRGLALPPRVEWLPGDREPLALELEPLTYQMPETHDLPSLGGATFDDGLVGCCWCVANQVVFDDRACTMTHAESLLTPPTATAPPSSPTPAAAAPPPPPSAASPSSTPPALTTSAAATSTAPLAGTEHASSLLIVVAVAAAALLLVLPLAAAALVVRRRWRRQRCATAPEPPSCARMRTLSGSGGSAAASSAYLAAPARRSRTATAASRRSRNTTQTAAHYDEISTPLARRPLGKHYHIYEDAQSFFRR